MSAAAQKLKNFNLYIDGFGYAGNVDEVQLPAINVTAEDYRAGGMDAPIEIDMGMEKLEATFKVSKFDKNLLAKFGARNIPFVLRGALEDLDGTVTPLVVNLTGSIHGQETDAATPGTLVAMTFRFAAHAYTYRLGDEIIHDIDVLNMKRVINSVDRLAAIRGAIGL